MIKTEKNPNFPKWIQVFAFGVLIEEVEGRAKALRLATKVARENGHDSIIHLNKLISVKQ